MESTRQTGQQKMKTLTKWTLCLLFLKFLWVVQRDLPFYPFSPDFLVPQVQVPELAHQKESASVITTENYPWDWEGEENKSHS